MPVNANLFNDHASEARYYYVRNSSGVWSLATGTNPLGAGLSKTTNSATYAMGISKVALTITEINDETIFDDGIYVDVSRNSLSPYSASNLLNYANHTSTTNPQSRNGGVLFKRSYNCIASDKELAEFAKEFKDDVTPDLIFEYHKMNRQEDLFFKNTAGHCRIIASPLRSMFGGAPGIRGQSHEEDSAGHYKITLGDTVVNSS
tara:strand:+ start:198 stop:809 length:612 start_codon:yes stop_codon:yes gene_type:complete